MKNLYDICPLCDAKLENDSWHLFRCPKKHYSYSSRHIGRATIGIKVNGEAEVFNLDYLLEDDDTLELQKRIKQLRKPKLSVVVYDT